MTNRIDEELEKTAAPASAEMCPPLVAQPKDNGTAQAEGVPGMTPGETMQAAVAEATAFIKQLGLALDAKVWAEIDEHGITRHYGRPIFVRQRPDARL